MKKTESKKSTEPLKTETHISFALAWRGSKDHTNFAYAQSAIISWSKQLSAWVLTSFLNGSKARSALINKGDFVWQAANEPIYFKLVNSGDTVAFIRESNPSGTWSVWDGERLVRVANPSILRKPKQS